MSVLSSPWIDGQDRQLDVDKPLALLLTTTIVLAFVATDQRLWHWFVLPVFLCGLLIGPDAIRWLRGQYDLYDPKGVVGILGYYYFFLTPLFFVSGGAQMSQVDNLSDWRPWVGTFAALNLIGLLLYHLGHRIGFRGPKAHVKGADQKLVIWTIDLKRAQPWIVLFALVALLTQSYFWVRSGGIAGIIQRATAIKQTGQMETTGLGLFDIPGRALPMLVLLYLCLVRQRSGRDQPTSKSALILLAFLGAFQFLLVGFAGSRSATVWSLFWLAGTVHYCWRPIDRRSVLIGMAVLILFMYIYGFFKDGGAEAIKALAQGSSFSELEQETGRTFQGMLIGDLSRVDVQSYQLYKLQDAQQYDLRWGKTYLSAFTRDILSWIWRSRPPDSEKVVAATELFKGRGSYIPGDLFRNSSKVMGMAGEAMLNFGVWSAPLPFLFLGFLVGRHRRAMLRWHPTDARWFLAGFVTLLLFISLFSDLENLVSTFVGKGSYITLLILLTSRRSVTGTTLLRETST